MLTNVQKLSSKLRKINTSLFFDNFPENKKINYDINNQMMFIGTEFEMVFTSILGQKFGIKAGDLKVFLKKNELLNQTYVKELKGKEIKKISSFNLQKFLKEYNYQGNIKTKKNFEKDENHIKELLKKIDFEKFKPKKHIITKVRFKTKLSICSTPFSGEIDLIIDDKLIDIKTDTTLKLNKNYIVQLLYYYFLIKHSQSVVNDEENLLEKIKINKLCLYYASFDLLIEFDVDKLFSNKKYLNEIDDLVHNDLINYNFKFEEILKSVVFDKELNEEYFQKTLAKINDNQKEIFKSNIDSTFNVDFEISNNIDFKKEFLLQVIKTNLILMKANSTDSLPDEVEKFVLKHLILRFKDSLKKDFNQPLTKFNEKHLYMSLKNCRQIDYIHWILSLRDKNRDYENNNFHIDELIKMESENEEEFNFFIKNSEALYFRFYNQMTNQIISENEFKLICEFMLRLIEFEKHRKKTNCNDLVIMNKVTKLLRMNLE